MSYVRRQLRTFLLSTCAVFLLLLAPLAPSATATSESNGSDLDYYKSKIAPYIRSTESGAIYFDEQAARTDNADEITLKIGNNFNLISHAYEVEKHPEYGKDRGGLPIWGNWCGPLHSGPGKPIDRLDTACMHHDQCYGKRGYFSCSCDQELLDEILRNVPYMNAGEYAMAVAVYAFFESSPCNPRT